MLGALLPTITDDLRITIGGQVTTLTPTQGLHLAEDLARKAFRRALTEEAGLADALQPVPPHSRKNPALKA